MAQILNKYKDGIPPNAVYIGRGSKWGNPFRINVDGDRVTVIKKYEQWLRNQRQLLMALEELRGVNLVCFCAPLACHGDILLWLINLTRDDKILWYKGELSFPFVKFKACD